MSGRYYLFGFDQYYPGGGLSDYRGAFDSPDAAAAFIRAAPSRDYWQLATIAADGNLVETDHWWSAFREAWDVPVAGDEGQGRAGKEGE